MFEQITLKKSNFSEKAIHLSIQKSHAHKQGNNHSLDRSEVAGSGKKLFKQKGTGNARAGNKKTTQRRGGGKAFGPKFHNVSFKVNKKVKKLAVISSLSVKSDNKSLYIFDEDNLNEKNLKELLSKNQNKLITLILKDPLNNSASNKLRNYKNLSLYSDTSYSINSSLKSDMLMVSNKSSIFSSYIGNNI
jgi:large subunit ribosomal protein L4